MKAHKVVAVTATLAATEYPVSAFGGNFREGQSVVMMLCKDGDFAGGDITIRTDNSQVSGSPAWETIRAAANGNAATTQMVEIFNVVLGDNIEVTAAAITVGGFELWVLGD